MTVIELYGALALLYVAVLAGVVTIGTLVRAVERWVIDRQRRQVLDLTSTLPAARGRFRGRRR